MTAGKPRQWTMPQSLAAILDDRLQAYPAVYRGVRMRSQLEADFAHHLDSQGAAWAYEPRRYSGYLPDFVVGTRFFEVKPTRAEVRGAEEDMSVVRETVPDAVLVVVCAEGCEYWVNLPGSHCWRRFVERWAHG